MSALLTTKVTPMTPLSTLRTCENQDLGVVKALRSPVSKLDLSPWTAPSQTLVQLP